jgi:serine/threonine-protein kinase
MEYVEGVPIDRFCTEREMALERRLELFCRVCAAVQYAHRSLVVHRDLKPANILVTTDGQVKLLDFGIAKLLDDGANLEASLTATGERLMTPMYASPEQVRGEAVSTATDVYALGVLLYELLTDRYPYRPATREPHAVVQAILEQEPERPSVVAPKHTRRLRGDLDTIVGKAMQKDPGRRYGTAEQLEADVRRHLGGLPVSARPDSPMYRAQKFIRRNRVGVAIATGVAVLVVAFGAVTAVQSVRIRNQATRIGVERDRAEQVSRFLAGLFQTADPFAGASAGLTAREMLDSGAARIDRELAGQPETRAQMMLEMARAYFGLGARERARRFGEVSLAIQRRLSPAVPLEIAQTLDFVGLVRMEQGELDGAERAYREALTLRRQLLGPQHVDVVRTLNGLAGVLRAEGRFRAADSVSREAVALDGAPLAESLEGLAHAVRERGEFAAAESLYARVLVFRRQALPEAHPEIASSIINLAASLGDAGRPAAADSLFRYGLGVKRRLLGREHPDIAADEAQYARLLHQRKSDQAAEALYRHALTIARQRFPGVHPVTATILLGLGELLLDRGAADRAEPLLREALAMRRTTLPPGHPGVSEVEQAIGAVIMARGRYVEAERYLLASRDGLRAAYGDADPRARSALTRLVDLYEASGQPARAASARAELEGGAPPVRRPRSASDGAPSVDSSAVSVLPFHVGAGDRVLTDLRDVFQDLLVARLTGPPSLGGRWVLRGDVTGTPPRLSLGATLEAVPSGGTRAQARVEGSADSLPSLADRLIARLLAVQAARDSDEFAALIGTSLPALRAYLAGLYAYRRGKCCSPSEAQDDFERALFLDSMFAIAGLALVETATWGMAEREERWRLDAIWQQRERLGSADQALLKAYLGPRYPRPATLAELIAASERATLVAPHRAEAWHIAGVNLFRFGPIIGYPGWEARAGESLRRALALDSTNAMTLQYVVRLAAAVGDSATVRRYTRLYIAHNPDAYETESIRWLAAVTLADSAGLAALRSRLRGMHRFYLRALVEWSPTIGVGFDDADQAARVYDETGRSVGERRAVIVGIVPYTLNRGRPGAASRLLATAERGFGERADVGVLEFRVYAALYWDGDSSEAAAAARSLEGYLAGAPVRQGYVRDPQTARCALAHWRLAAGDLAGAEAARGPLRAPYLVESTSVCVAAVDAQLAAARGRPDAGSTLERLDGLLAAGSDRRHLLMGVGNLIAARLYEARGDLRHALALTRRRNAWGNQLLSTQLREEGRLAALVGDTAGAVRAYRHYLALRSDPEPVLRPTVERVRAELVRLEGGRRP